jgi:FKBP-type peptidyl-prolyl cis-trans isomerase 2
MKKGDFIKIKFLGRIVDAQILDITDKWVKVSFECITYKTSINNIQK